MIDKLKLILIDKANTEVAGMDAYDLTCDYDFRHTFEDKVEDSEVGGKEIDF